MRPIDADALKTHVCEMCDDGQRECKGDESCAILCWINDMPTIEAEPVRKPKMSEADRKKCEEWCKDCEHIEMCAWYPFGGCDFRLLPKSEQEVSEDDEW